MGIEPTTKPWQGLVLPLAPYPHHVCIIYAFQSIGKHIFKKYLVRVTGVEPVRTRRQILSLLGLPIPPYSHHMAGPFPLRKPTSPPSSLIRFITSSKRIGLKSVCSTQTQWYLESILPSTLTRPV